MSAYDDEEEIPLELLDPPSGPYPPPPVETAEQSLPFDRLSWENFERLCLRVARLGGNIGRSRRYGDPGQAQYGIDFYVMLPTNRYASYQCKRIDGVAPGDIKAAVDKFLKHKRWSEVSDKFVFCTSERAVRTQLSDAIEAQRKRLTKRTKPIQFEVWDSEELSILLKDHEDLVRDFFGPAWTAAFFGKSREPDQSTEDLVNKVLARTQARTQFVTNDWAPERIRELLEALREEDSETFARLNDLVGSPPNTNLIRAAVKGPPEWLRNSDRRVWDVLARIAESRGEWAVASTAWEQLAERQPSAFSRAGSLVSAAVAAKMGADNNRYDDLIGRAEEADTRHPRLILEHLSEDTPPGEQLAIVQQLQSDDPDDLAQIAARRAMAELLTPNLPAACTAIEEVKELLPGSILAASLSISLTAQEGRLAILRHGSLDRVGLLAAATEAEGVRQRLIDQHRWLESTRLLMLRADIYSLLGERSKASKILREAREEEQRTTEQKIVLASSAAERALDWKLSRDFLDGADEVATTARLRLEISEAIGTPAERREALSGLDRLVHEAGPEAEHAAFLRLAATLGPTPTPWSDEAAVYLKENGHERAAVQAEAFFRQRESGYEKAVRLLQPYGNAPWVLATRLRLALNPHAPADAAVEAAENLLAIGPSHAARIEAAQGFGRAKNFPRARQELASVARDLGAPDSARADAYEKLMHVAGNEIGDWDFTAELYDEWVKVAPADNRAPKWAPRIANRRSRS